MRGDWRLFWLRTIIPNWNIPSRRYTIITCKVTAETQKITSCLHFQGKIWHHCLHIQCISQSLYVYCKRNRWLVLKSECGNLIYILCSKCMHPKCTGALSPDGMTKGSVLNAVMWSDAREDKPPRGRGGGTAPLLNLPLKRGIYSQLGFSTPLVFYSWSTRLACEPYIGEHRAHEHDDEILEAYEKYRNLRRKRMLGIWRQTYIYPGFLPLAKLFCLWEYKRLEYIHEREKGSRVSWCFFT